MAKKEFKFHSKTLEELKALSLNDLSLLLPSRQRRSIKRGFCEEKKKLLKKLETKNNVKTHLRDMIVLPSMVDKTILIYSGQKFEPVTIRQEMIGQYFGEFVLTRRHAVHTNIGVTNKPKK
ncbi:MAG: ribosomal protein S19 family protein [Candidatus Woesearchaeota archaeon]